MFPFVLFFSFCKSDYYYYCNCVWGSLGHFLLSSQIFYFFYYYVCLPQLIWNSSACRKHIPGKPGLVYAQAGPNWVAAGPVPTPLPRKLRPSAVGSSPPLLAQPTTTSIAHHSLQKSSHDIKYSGFTNHISPMSSLNIWGLSRQSNHLVLIVLRITILLTI